MLELKNLSISLEDRNIANAINMKINDGEVHAVMGPNGAGKSSLALAIMGHPNYKINGKIILDGTEITKMTVDQRANAGIFLAFQNPEEIEGVKISTFLRKARSVKNEKKRTMDEMLAEQKEIEANAKRVGMGFEFIKRELNVGFSGGEKKRMEIVQMMALAPKIIMLDEIDSGLDVDGLKQVAKAIESMRDGKRSFLIITHYPRILNYVKPDKVHVMIKGNIVETGGKELAQELEKEGYTNYNEK